MARPPSDIRERIVIAARARFLIEGVDGAALRQIAKDAGTNIGMVYYYYKTKDELFLAVVEAIYGGLLADIEATLNGELSEEQRFLALYLRLSQLSEDEFQVVRLVLREALVSSTRLASIGRLFFRGHAALVMRTVAQGIDAGRLRADLPPLLLTAASMLLGFMPQVARRMAARTDTPMAALLPEPEAIARGMAKLLFHGIAADSKRPPKRT